MRLRPFGELPNAPKHNPEEEARNEFLEKEARAARQASGYKVRWRIVWSQVVGLLLAAAIIAGFVLLLGHLLPHLLR
jgi:hypothetical protein